MSEWKPIETAPRDGTKIWGWMYDSGIVLMHWMSAEENAAEDGSDNPDDYISCWVKSGEPDEDAWPKFWQPFDAIGVPPGVVWTGSRWRNVDQSPPLPLEAKGETA